MSLIVPVSHHVCRENYPMRSNKRMQPDLQKATPFVGG